MADKPRMENVENRQVEGELGDAQAGACCPPRSGRVPAFFAVAMRMKKHAPPIAFLPRVQNARHGVRRYVPCSQEVVICWEAMC